MDIVWVVLLVSATAYASALSFALRGYTRAGLTAILSDNHRSWLDRLDRYERQLQLVASIARLVFLIALVAWVFYANLRGLGPIEPAHLVAPALISLGLLLVFAIAVPNAIATHVGEAFLAFHLPVLWALSFALYPLERMLWLIDVIVRRLVGRPESTPDEHTFRIEQEILTAVSEGEAQGAVDEGQKEMIRSVIEMHQITVNTIMTPRTDIVGVPVTATFDEVRDLVVDNGHSRIPVFERTIDHIVGVLYAKDMLKLRPGEPFDARKLMRNAPYVPLTKTLGELLDEFRESKVQIAIVLDEYGGTAGLATIEDILEELVGEIDDEYDQPESPNIKRIDDDTVELESRVPIYAVNAELGVRLPEDGDFATIGGFVFSTLGRIPAKGEEFTFEGMQFRVEDAEARKINRLRIKVLRESATA